MKRIIHIGKFYFSSSTQIYTDACYIYQRQPIKQANSDAMILRGREIAYEAANSLPMPSYTDDQIREVYGELDNKTRRLQEDQYILRKPLIDAWNEKSSWKNSSDECPLPKFRLDETIFMSAYLSTGLSNPRIKPSPIIINQNEKEIIRGSFRTSIDDRTIISPSPLLLNVKFDFNKFKTNLNDQISLLDDIQNNISFDKQSDIHHNELKSTNS